MLCQVARSAKRKLRMQTISVVRNAETISLTTITKEGVVCVDIPLPNDTGKCAVIRSEVLNLNAQSVKNIKTKSNLENRNTTDTADTAYAIPVSQGQPLPTWKECFAKCTKKTFRRQKQGTGVRVDDANHTPKKKSTKVIHGEKKTK
jgi:hypothetical protein